MTPVTLQNLTASLALPEIFLFLASCGILLAGLFLPKASRARMCYGLSLAALLISAALVAHDFAAQPQYAFNRMFIDDGLADLLKIAICLAAAAAFVYGYDYNRARGIFQSEYYVLGLFAVIGMMIMASASHLLTLYLGLELMSLCLYSMIAFYRDDKLAVEAAMKYFVLGALASSILLYGMSLLYGLSGSLQLAEIGTAMASAPRGHLDLAIALAVVFVVVALAFKLGAVPFHMWLPDVYHGAPTSTTAFIAAAPKLAAFAMVMRLLIGGLEDLHGLWQQMLIILALLSVAVGNLVAIAQDNFKRMLAYSAISHIGFFLFGIISGNAIGYSASLFYVLVYAVMSLAAFGLVLFLASADNEADQLADLKGLSQHHPMAAVLMLVVMLSMAGIPPTLGFFAKLAVIQALITAGLLWVAVVAVLFAVVGAFYYLRVLKLVFFDQSEPRQRIANHPSLKVVLCVNVLLIIAILPWVGHLLTLCKSVVKQFSV